jgi:site-specific DNA-methyltransferase (adenine-specific)
MDTMKPYYEQSGITIYHSDCRDVLASMTQGIDLVVTDPPYGINGRTQGQRAKAAYDGGFEDTADYIKTVVVPVIEACIAAARTVVVTPGNKNLCAYPQPDSFGCFYQPAAIGLQGFGNLDAQPIFYYGHPGGGGRMGKPCSFVLTETPEQNGHPCPKPFAAWKRLIATVALPGQVIFDPFLGSGTTLVAAKHMGHPAIGCDINERYCEIAANRLRQEVLFGDLNDTVRPADAQPEQSGLFS